MARSGPISRTYGQTVTSKTTSTTGYAFAKKTGFRGCNISLIYNPVLKSSHSKVKAVLEHFFCELQRRFKSLLTDVIFVLCV